MNCTWARIVHRQDMDISGRLAEYRFRGISVMLVFDKTSIEAYPSPADAFTDALRRYDQYVTLWQPGNEPDGTDASSWTMTQDEFVTLGRTARATLGRDRLIVAGGLVSGDPTWLVGQDLSWCDMIDVHLYLKDAPNPNDIEDVPDIDQALPGYQALGLPVILGEWGWWGNDEERGREEVDDMVGWVAPRTDVPIFFYFCADDAMVAPFGLVRADGSLKPAYGAFTRQAANAVPVPLPTPGHAPPAPTPEPVPALAPLDQAYAALWQAVDDSIPLVPDSALYKAWRANHRDWGSPITGEIPDADGTVLQTFAVAGPMRWTGGDSVEAA
jgi:hypothetical protein